MFKKNTIFLFVVLYCFFFQTPTHAQNNEDIEVYLAFRHRGVISRVVITYYKDDIFYLPINELFDIFQLEANSNGLITEGKFSTAQTPYTIDLSKQIIKFGGKTFKLDSNDFLIKELDNYLPPKIYSEVFGLNFDVDFNTLILNLQTNVSIPVIEKGIRDQRRRIADKNRFSTTYYPLSEGRKKSVLNAGFLDYSLSSYISDNNDIYNVSTSLGMELAGGDLQGNIFGSYSNSFTNLETSNFRWRYVIRDQPWITKLTVGQTSLDGVLKNPYTGIRLTNEPVEPRKFFDEFLVQGTTIPQSDVELYLNNSIIDFQKADALGNYSFLAPLYYGSSQLDLKIFGPTGQIIERSSRIQVPFTFTPKGEINYKINAGILDNPIIGSTSRSTVVQGNTSYGLTNWLSTKVGVEYFENGLEKNIPSFNSMLSARAFNNYILTFQGVTSAYYRSSLNAIYANSASINIDYTNYIASGNIYNNTGTKSQLVTSISHPLNILKVPFNFRISTFTSFRETSDYTSFRFDTGTRIASINLRFAYADRLIETYNPLNSSSAARLETSLTYNISRNPNIPAFIRGTFLRAQMRYIPSDNKIESIQGLFSRNLFNSGRIQFGLGRNFITDINSLRLNLIFDFNKVRTNSTFANVQKSYSTTQSIRGSVGYDSNYNNFIFTSRDQVGRSGSAIRLFVDDNSNGKYDKNENIISEGAMRIGQTGTSSIYKNGILYYTQMQPYYRYNIEVNKGSIRNPMLVPELEKFSIITDPNTFKKIELPFYMSGVIEGLVERKIANGKQIGVGGLKLLLTSEKSDFNQELRTFSDGSFYTYELPPGKYKLSIAQEQLDILKSESLPKIIEFEIEAVPEGDFIEGLSFVIVPKKPLIDKPIPTETILADITESSDIIELKAELEKEVSETLRFIVLAQTAFYNGNIDRALSLVNESLSLFKTAQGYALKGSLNYLQGNKSEAQKNWGLATELNPNILIPDIEALDQIIKTQLGE